MRRWIYLLLLVPALAFAGQRLSGSEQETLHEILDPATGKVSPNGPVVPMDENGDATVRHNLNVGNQHHIRSRASENLNGDAIENNAGNPTCSACGFSARTGRPFFCTIPQAAGWTRSCFGITDSSIGFPVKLQTNGGAMTGTAATMFGTDDQCYCYLTNLLLPMTDIDDLGIGVQTADSGDSDDVYRFALYSEDGRIPYFVSTADVSTPYTSGVKFAVNSITAPPVLPPGRYWACAACNDPNGTCSTQLRTNSSAVLGAFLFTQTCTGATMPASLTNPVGTWTSNQQPMSFELVDE